MLNCLQIRYEAELELTSNKPLIHAHSQQRAWLSSKSDLIKLSDNLNISHDP